MQDINLNKCDSACKNCILGYIKKHSLKQGSKFKVQCNGIPEDYLPDSILAEIEIEKKTALSMLDPVSWASTFLDWHCLDPDGEVWKRKTEEGSLPPEAAPYDEKRAKVGRSIFHRPYQATMLRCSSKRKVFRIGRQAGKTESLIISMLYALFTHSMFKIVVIAPYQSQIDMIFGRLSDLIKSNPILRGSISRNVKAPQYTIELLNGSHAIGFTAGTRSGQDAGSSRGQPANMLVFDEADYLSPGDIQATLATILNFPNATVWMSSTPTGRREKFYESCMSNMWKEYHFPSHVNPNWDEEQEEFFRNEYTEDQYKHEILAEFGEMEEGVYKNKYVMQALADYEYGDIRPDSGHLFAIGVDWNDSKIGTTIAVVGFNPGDNKFYLVDQHVITAGNLTQLTACNKIAELTRHWRPFAVYVDRGHGVGQDEILRKYGMDALADPNRGPHHPDSILRHTKAYHFGGQIETYDLFSKTPVKKPAKPFLVENSVRRFETYSFKFPKSDEKYMKALQGYIVKRVSNAGAPIYEQQNTKYGDHMIDAVNLALVAFTLEKSEYGKPKLDFSVSFTDRLTPTLDGSTRRTDEEDERPRIGARTDRLFHGDSIYKQRHDVPGIVDGDSQGVKLWAWPGFGKDEPKPRIRTLSEAFQQAEKKLGNGGISRGGGHRPRRSKF